MNGDTRSSAMEQPSSDTLFDALARKDYDALTELYALNAQKTIFAFLSMRSRWSSVVGSEGKSEEKLDEFLQQLAYQEPYRRDRIEGSSGEAYNPTSLEKEELSYNHILMELAEFQSERKIFNNNQAQGKPKMDHHGVNRTISLEIDRLLWDSAAIFSDSRPPSEFVVYNSNGDTSPPEKQEGPPIFDGSVANSTPPPLGGAAVGASGGSGTIQHLACALDMPLALALFLAMGSDARATHTAFRRLMIHEAACNGSINCLTLLLELGRSCSNFEDTCTAKKFTKSTSFASTKSGGFVPFRAESNKRFREHQDNSQMLHDGNDFSEQDMETLDFVQFLRFYRYLCDLVRRGSMSELDASRLILSKTHLRETSRLSLSQSCSFHRIGNPMPRGMFRSHGGSADGHGNTPLHWAAFKNETPCVSLLLHYNADANARAHPSGWTPLHDAAYSNSSDSIEMLLNAGAEVDARANSGATPLCFAAQENASSAAGLLLSRGADITTRCAGGPVRDDTSFGGQQMAHHPHSRFSGYTPLHYCAHYNAFNAAHVLLKHTAAHAAMEIPDLSDRLPIHVAVARGSSDVLRELLHAGARVDTPRANVKRSLSSVDQRQQAQARTIRRQSDRNPPVELTVAIPPPSPQRRQPPSPEIPSTPTRAPIRHSASFNISTPVSSPILRAMIPSQPITSSKPWNCLSQRSIDECRELISHAEQSWTPDRHTLFTPADRRAVIELLRVGKRLEQQGTGIFIDLWPFVLSFCGRGWFEVEEGNDDGSESSANNDESICSFENCENADDDHLALPMLSR